MEAGLGPRPSYEEARRAIASVGHWHHRIEVLPGLVTPGAADASHLLPHLGIPEECSGLRVLDIGARDGFFSFELERRGADVTALDYVPAEQTGFATARALLGSRVEHRVDNVYNLSRATHGAFDLVLFLGVLYHLRDPLLALDRIWDVCTDRLVVETQTLDEGFLDRDGRMGRLADLAPALADAAIAQFYPGDALGGDNSNWWSPSAACLKGLLDAAGFEVDFQLTSGSRGIARAGKVLDPTRLHHRQVERGVFLQDRAPETDPDWLMDRIALFEPAERERAAGRGHAERLTRAQGELHRARAEETATRAELERVRAELDEGASELRRARAALERANRQLEKLRASRMFRYTATARRLWYRLRR